MRHEMLTQRALFCHRANTKRGTLSQHFVTRVVPPLVCSISSQYIIVSSHYIVVCSQNIIVFLCILKLEKLFACELSCIKAKCVCAKVNNVPCAFLQNSQWVSFKMRTFRSPFQQ